jgi:hypothetical protein
MSTINPSKGVDYYAFIAKKNYSVVFSAPKNLNFSVSDITFNNTDDDDHSVAIQHGHLEISEMDIGLLNHTGEFQWNVYDEKKHTIERKYIDISPLTGNTGNTNIESTLDENSIIKDDYAISYGFYDASSGDFSVLTNHDQSYVYVTQNLSTWMGDMIKNNAKYKDCPLHTFALAGSHDAGMYNNDAATNLMTNTEYSDFIIEQTKEYHDNAFDPIIEAIIKVDSEIAQKLIKTGGKNIIVNLAMTQKDNIKTQLNLGIRYLDIRPGFCAYANTFSLPQKVEDATDVNNLFHQHKLVPGMDFETILNQILIWLNDNKTEIVVVSLNFQGFFSDEMKPSSNFIQTYIDSVVSTNKINLKSGSQEDLTKTYQELIDSNKRLIFLNQLEDKSDAIKYDSYTKSYETTNVDNIIQALNDMKDNPAPATYDYMVLQLQGTANAILSDIADSSIMFSKKTSPLMSTKAMFDTQTYTWIYEHAAKDFDTDHLMVFLNDFSDNALAHQSMVITKNRMDTFLSKKA